MALDYHDKFDKAVNEVRVESWGGGAPRRVNISVTLSEDDRIDLPALTLDQCRDLRYLLDRLLE